jgi:alkylated DNA repair dioxygenase AlkB
MVKLIRNVGGVLGLDIALEAFSEEIELGLFSSPALFKADYRSSQSKKRQGDSHTHPHNWDPTVWKLTTLIRQVHPEHNVQPNYCFAQSYPKGAGFMHHFDSRHRWGETVVGVSMGQSCVMYFTPHEDHVKKRGPPTEIQEYDGIKVHVRKYKRKGNDNKTTTTGAAKESGKEDGWCVEVQIPRRSIYVMSGEVRYDWKHGIRSQTDKLLLKVFSSPPRWNPYNIRRSFTFRATKAYSDAYLQHLLTQDPFNESLQRRIRAQSQFRPQIRNGERLKNEELAEERARAERELKSILSSPYFGATFQKINFPPVEGFFQASGAVFGSGSAAGSASKTKSGSAATTSNAFAGVGHRLGSGPSAVGRQVPFYGSGPRTLGAFATVIGGPAVLLDDDEKELQAALEASRREAEMAGLMPSEEDQLKASIEASLGGISSRELGPFSLTEAMRSESAPEDVQLKAAIRASQEEKESAEQSEGALVFAAVEAALDSQRQLRDAIQESLHDVYAKKRQLISRGKTAEEAICLDDSDDDNSEPRDDSSLVLAGRIAKRTKREEEQMKLEDES